MTCSIRNAPRKVPNELRRMSTPSPLEYKALENVPPRTYPTRQILFTRGRRPFPVLLPASNLSMQLLTAAGRAYLNSTAFHCRFRKRNRRTVQEEPPVQTVLSPNELDTKVGEAEGGRIAFDPYGHIRCRGLLGNYSSL